MTNIILLTTFFILPYFVRAQQDTLRFVSYNLLNFPSENGAGRIPDFRKVLHAIDPDILVVQELESQAGLVMLQNEVLNHTSVQYQAAPFTQQPTFLNSSLFFKQDKIILLGLTEIPGNPRYITEYVLLVSGQEFNIYSVHFKAGSEPPDQNNRLVQATNLRNHLNSLPANSNFMLAGDYNMRSASEDAFVRLTESQTDNDGRLFDPLRQLGEWHNNSFFRLIHTQSTRTTAFGNGSTGGLDDRFDMILVSDALLEPGGMIVLPAFTQAFGNDGDHFNMAVNIGTNLVVPDSIADALHQSSDHLPVVADFVLGAPSSVATAERYPEHFRLLQNYPNPFNPHTTIEFELLQQGIISLRVIDLQGKEISVLLHGFMKNGVQRVTFDGSNAASGLYFYELRMGHNRAIGKMLLLR